MKTLTYKELLALKPCEAGARASLFDGDAPATAAQAFERGASVKDVLWVMGELGMSRECAQVALFAARLVAHHNSDPRVQAAIDATQAWLDDPSAENRSAASDAAYAARATAYAAYAADAADAACAAYAARAAAYASDAARAAAYASDAARAAAYAAYASDAARATAYAAYAAIRAEIIRILG
jgi:hypothetical protein